MKENYRKIIKALILCFIAAFVMEAAFCVYRIRRGYGNEANIFPLTPDYTVDYVQNQDGVWINASDNPQIVFRTDEPLGHIFISLEEPMSCDANVLLYYVASPDIRFDRLLCESLYIMEGSKKAVINAPFGNNSFFRLEIVSPFHPGEMFIVPAVALSDMTLPKLFGQFSIPRFLLVFVVLFSARLSGIHSSNKAAELKTVSEAGGTPKKRLAYLDALRVIATFSVISVHVIEPVILQLPQGSKIEYAVKTVSMCLLTCNLLFVMISGSLLIPNRSEKVKDFIRK